MSTHHAVIEAGPGTIRRLCCGAAGSVAADTELVAAALDGIDDPAALVGERPVSVDSLWRTALRSLDCRQQEPQQQSRQKPMVIVHPSWWAPSRVATISSAARTLGGDVLTRRRSWLLARASSAVTPETVVVEIADRVVVVTGTAMVAEPRNGEPHRVAEAVTRVVVGMTRSTGAPVLIDGPGTVGGAAAMAVMIAGGVRTAGVGVPVVVVDDDRLRRLAAVAASVYDEQGGAESAGRATHGRPRNRVLALLVGSAVVLATTILCVGTLGRHGEPTANMIPMTFLVEGRIALTVPAQWPVRRVIAGPGSARVEVTSPSDPEVVLHVTQSLVPGEMLSNAADLMKRAIDAEPTGVFVDFDPSGRSAGRPAVTYREVRAGHDIRWTVLLDGAVRISVGCQSRPGGEDAVRDVCEQAVRSARALG